MPRPRLARGLGLLVLLGGLGVAAPASACPDCAIGREARGAVWSDGFARNLAVAALPFVVIGAICARAEAGGRRRAPVETTAHQPRGARPT